MTLPEIQYKVLEELWEKFKYNPDSNMLVFIKAKMKESYRGGAEAMQSAVKNDGDYLEAGWMNDEIDQRATDFLSTLTD